MYRRSKSGCCANRGYMDGRTVVGNLDHVLDQKISDQNSRPRTKIRTGPDFWYGPVIHVT